MTPSQLARFSSALFQYASNITTIGADPYILPQRVDRTATGFKMAFLMQNGLDNSFQSIGDVEATVEPQADGVNVLFLRGTGKVVAGTMPDIPRLMSEMPSAIRRSIALAMEEDDQ